jgi:hypothetical protein
MKWSNVFRFFKSLFGKKDAPNAYYLSLCAIIKDENAYLEEWIRYHLKIGVEHFFIYDNDSKIPVAKTLADLGLAQYVTVKTISGKSKQVKAYQHCLNVHGSKSNWIGFIDLDEFIVPKSTKGRMDLFLKPYEPYGGLGLSWFIFGSNGHQYRTNKPQIESFTYRSKPDFLPNSHIKSVVQPKFVKAAYNAHAFHYLEGKFCVDEHFTPIHGAFTPHSSDTIQLNHYYCRSFEEFQDKLKRGMADTKKQRKMEQFHYHDGQSNLIEDRTILDISRNLDSI